MVWTDSPAGASRGVVPGAAAGRNCA